MHSLAKRAFAIATMCSALATVCSLGCERETSAEQGQQEQVVRKPVSATETAREQAPDTRGPQNEAPAEGIANAGVAPTEPPRAAAEEKPVARQPLRERGDKFVVREYASPGGPAGVAPIPDYPKRASEQPASKPPASERSAAPSVTIEQNNYTTINNNFFAPYLDRQPPSRHDRDRGRPRTRGLQTPQRNLHPTVTTPVHPAVTTPVHP